MLWPDTPKIEPVMLRERVMSIASRSFKGEFKIQALRCALNSIDLTTLEGKDTDQRVVQLCQKAVNWKTAAVCVYPINIAQAKLLVNGSGVKVASVAAGFPSAQLPYKLRCKELEYALSQGADEIDVVMNRKLFLQGQYKKVYKEIEGFKKLCGSVTLKVILETGELERLEFIRKAADIALYAGADFIKTSTGKTSVSARNDVVYVMMGALAEYHAQTQKKAGIKASGGISTSKQALQYMALALEVLGPEWMHPQYFRFGASSLANNIQLQLLKQTLGVYPHTMYISTD